MNVLIPVLAIAAVLGSGLIAGVFFAFSSFVMKALARLPEAGGIAAMQAINVVVINPHFLGAFLGTALLSLALIVVAVLTWDGPGAPFWLAGALSYLLGTFLVTVARNVPLNEELSAMSPDTEEAARTWSRYLLRWTAWNHVRTAAAFVAALLYCLGLARVAAA